MNCKKDAAYESESFSFMDYKQEKDDITGCRISVVIPAYNAEDTIERAVESVYAQSYKNTEIIVVNDGSKDKTAVVLEELKKIHQDMIIIEKPNGGVSSARNAGIKRAGGEFLITLDDDDYIDSDMLSDMYERLLQDKSDTVICGFRNIWQDGRIEDFNSEINECFDIKSFVNGPLMSMYDKRLISTHSNKLYKMNIIRDNNIYYEEGRQINEDILFCLKYLNKCRNISVTDKIYMNYVQHSFGESLISSFHEDGISSCFPVAEAFKELAEPYAEPDVINIINNRMLLHILSFNGIMYRYSGYSSKKKLRLLKKFCAEPLFIKILEHTKADDIKTRIACFLLKHRLYMLYHFLCRIIYR